MISIWEADSLSVLVPVKDSDGEDFDLTGAAVEAVAQRVGGPVIEATTQVVEGGVSVTFAPGTFASGTFNGSEYQFHVRVAKDGEVNTVLATVITVSRSVQVPA
jgi:hypothetical protein